MAGEWEADHSSQSLATSLVQLVTAGVEVHCNTQLTECSLPAVPLLCYLCCMQLGPHCEAVWRAGNHCVSPVDRQCWHGGPLRWPGQQVQTGAEEALCETTSGSNPDKLSGGCFAGCSSCSNSCVAWHLPLRCDEQVLLQLPSHLSSASTAGRSVLHRT